MTNDEIIERVVQDIAKALSKRDRGLKFKPANPRPDGMNENNDCVVRALSLAFNKPYTEVHKACADAGRRPRRGMFRHQTDKAIQTITGKPDASGSTFPYRHHRPTFAQFAAMNPEGNFIVIKRGHAVALIDGVYHDIGNSAGCGARCRVQYYYRAA